MRSLPQQLLVNLPAISWALLFCLCTDQSEATVRMVTRKLVGEINATLLRSAYCTLFRGLLPVQVTH